MHKYSTRKLLNIPGFTVEKIVSETESEIRFQVRAYKRKKAICSNCGQVHEKGYHGSKEGVVEDRSLGERRVYFHLIKRQYRCPEDGRIYVEEIGWVKKYCRVTVRYAEQVYRLTAITTNQEAGWFLHVDDEIIYRIDKEMLEEKAKETLNPTPAAVNLSVDEVSYRKYHRYLTNVIDTDRRLLIWNDKGRKSEVLDQYYEGIGKENCRKIQSVALDGARTYISSTNQYAVNAMIVYDKFHVIQKLNRAVDTVRKFELRKARLDQNQELIDLIGVRQRFILLKNKSNLSEKQQEYLNRLCHINEPIYKAMLLKESFQSIYSYEDIDSAKGHLHNWIQQAQSSRLIAFIELAQSFKDKMQYLLNWFHKKISSAISEGFNNKIKRLKRMAYGYKDIEYFKLKIHQHCGLLNPRLFST